MRRHLIRLPATSTDPSAGFKTLEGVDGEHCQRQHSPTYALGLEPTTTAAARATARALLALRFIDSQSASLEVDTIQRLNSGVGTILDFNEPESPRSPRFPIRDNRG